MTNEEIDKIVFLVTEKVLLRMPEVIGNLMQNHAEVNKLTKSFYEEYPEFKADPISVKSIVGMLEEQNAGMKYDKILEKAAPLIKERIQTVKSLDFKNVSKKENLDLSFDNSNGEL